MAQIIIVINIIFSLFLFHSTESFAEEMKNINSNDVLSLIVQANDLYKKGNYKDSIDIYERIENHGYINGNIFYNMGNAYYRQGKIGKAILSYNKAKNLIPRDEDLQTNLDYLRKQIKDQDNSDKSSAFQTLFFWIYMFNLNEFIYGLLIINGILFLFLTLRVFYKSGAIKTISTVIALLYMLSLFSVFGKYIIERNKNHGIVIADEINIRSGIGFDNVILFKLHEGADFEIEEEKDNWLKIFLNDGKRGWVEKDFVGI